MAYTARFEPRASGDVIVIEIEVGPQVVANCRQTKSGTKMLAETGFNKWDNVDTPLGSLGYNVAVSMALRGDEKRRYMAARALEDARALVAAAELQANAGKTPAQVAQVVQPSRLIPAKSK